MIKNKLSSNFLKHLGFIYLITGALAWSSSLYFVNDLKHSLPTLPQGLISFLVGFGKVLGILGPILLFGGVLLVFAAKFNLVERFKEAKTKAQNAQANYENKKRNK